MTDPLLPNLFVIGAAKCGTSSLHHYLGLHPEVSMTSFKEPQVFAYPDYRARLGSYAPLLSGVAPARGESSAVYSQFPRWPGVPERIHSLVPHARLIYVVGDPVDRVVAHYAQLVLNGREARPFDEAIEDVARPDSRYLCPSRYATQIRRYLEWFPPSQLLVLDQADLLKERRRTVAEAYRFLGVDPDFHSKDLDERVNTRQDHRLPTAVGRRMEALRGTRPFEAARSMPVPALIRRPVRRVISRQIERPSLDRRQRERIAEVLRAEMEWLRGFSGRDFATWSV